MVARNTLTTATPYAVEQAIKKMGNHLRIARLRRKLTIEEVAEKIGTGPRAVRAAEHGHPSTGIAVYAALLWAFNLLPSFEEVTDPRNDEEGLALAESATNARVRRKRDLDDDF